MRVLHKLPCLHMLCMSTICLRKVAHESCGPRGVPGPFQRVLCHHNGRSGSWSEPINVPIISEFTRYCQEDTGPDADPWGAYGLFDDDDVVDCFRGD